MNNNERERKKNQSNQNNRKTHPILFATKIQFRLVYSVYDFPSQLHSRYYGSLELYEFQMQKPNLNNVTIHLIGQFFHS